jgi:hypothetical protein
MKWLYIIGGVLLFLIVGKLMNEYAIKDVDQNVEIIHGGAQP